MNPDVDRWSVTSRAQSNLMSTDGLWHLGLNRHQYNQQLSSYAVPIQQFMILHAAQLPEDPLRAVMVFYCQLWHKLTNQANRIVEVRSGDSKIDRASDNLSGPCGVARHFGFGAKLLISVRRICDEFAIHHSKLQEHTENIVSFTDEYTLWSLGSNEGCYPYRCTGWRRCNVCGV